MFHDFSKLGKKTYIVHDLKNIHWVRPDLKITASSTTDYDARIRYRQPLTKCKISYINKELQVLFNEKQRGIASGQFVSWYKNDELIGSGIIN